MELALFFFPPLREAVNVNGWLGITATTAARQYVGIAALFA